MAKSRLNFNRYTKRQLIFGLILAVSLAGNIAAGAAAVFVSNPASNYYLHNIMIHRMCSGDNLRYNLDQIPTERSKAFYSVSVCVGWNYKNGTQMSDDIEAMIQKVEDTQAPAGTVKAP